MREIVSIRPAFDSADTPAIFVCEWLCFVEAVVVLDHSLPECFAIVDLVSLVRIVSLERIACHLIHHVLHCLVLFALFIQLEYEISDAVVSITAPYEATNDIGCNAMPLD